MSPIRPSQRPSTWTRYVSTRSHTSPALFTNRAQEVKLAETRAERDLQDSLAEIFSIIVTLDELEKAFLKDAIPEADYTEICERSLKQYKSILADETVAKAFVGLEEFKSEWEVRSRLFPTSPTPKY
jgi:ESCRT-I complex subunit VPS28